MATDIRIDPIGEINKYDFRNEEKYVFKARKGLEPRDRRRDFGDEGRARLDAGLPAEEPGDLRVQAHAALGRRHRHQVRGHLLLPEADRPPGEDLGRGAGGNQEHLRPAGHPRGREEVPGRREGPVRERSGLRLAARGDVPAGRDLHRHRLGRPRAPRPGARVLRHDHPADRQQVRRARIRPSGRAGRSSTCRRA